MSLQAEKYWLVKHWDFAHSFSYETQRGIQGLIFEEDVKRQWTMDLTDDFLRFSLRKFIVKRELIYFAHLCLET